METVATVLYARLRNVLPLCNTLPPELGAGLGDELRAVMVGMLLPIFGLDMAVMLAAGASCSTCKPPPVAAAKH